jgi:hypothetical protein
VTEYSTPPSRRTMPFPAEWGDVPVDPDRRAAWILECIEEGRAARARGEQVRWLHHPSPQEVQLHLIAHVESPVLATARREALLAVTRATGRLLDLAAQREAPT